MTFGRKQARAHARFDTTWALSVLLSPISNALLDPAKLMYLDEKTPRAEENEIATMLQMNPAKLMYLDD